MVVFNRADCDEIIAATSSLMVSMGARQVLDQFTQFFADALFQLSWYLAALASHLNCGWQRLPSSCPS